MRLAYIIDHFYSDLAGTEHQLAMMIRGLARHFEIELILLRGEGGPAGLKDDLPCGVRVFQIDNFRQPRTYRQMAALVRHLRIRRPDVVHTFFPVSNIVGVMCARAAGISATVASRRDFGEWMSPRYLAATRFANRFVQRIVTNSPEVKRMTGRVEGFPGGRIEVIHNGIAVESFRRSGPVPGLRQALGIADTRRVVGLVANFRPMKRQATFVRAAQRLLRTRDDVEFLMVGDNAQKEDIKGGIRHLVTDLGLGERVHFAHAKGNVRDYLSIIDVGVNCSEGEGLSNAVMEYMASGIPCVVAASGGNPDLITDGVNGVCFPLDDDAALAAGVARMLDHAGERERLTLAALERVRRDMSFESMVARFRDFYLQLATAASGSTASSASPASPASSASSASSAPSASGAAR